MDRKPVFDAIAFERGATPHPDQVKRIDDVLFKLGFPPATNTPATRFVRPTTAEGLHRRSVVFAAFRDQLGTLRNQHILLIDDLLDTFGFPLAPLNQPQATVRVTEPITPAGSTKSAGITGSVTGQGALATVSKPKASTTSKVAAGVSLVALIGSAAALTVNSTLDRWEGNELDPYYDIVKVATNCRGNTTNVIMGKRLTLEQCAIINEAAAVKHTTPVLKATPLLTTPTATQQTHPNQLAAAISFAYNVGNGAYATSSIDRYFDQGYWYTACDKLLLWNKAGGKVVKGLTLRRQWERELCRKDVPLEYRK